MGNDVQRLWNCLRDLLNQLPGSLFHVADRIDGGYHNVPVLVLKKRLDAVEVMHRLKAGNQIPESKNTVGKNDCSFAHLCALRTSGPSDKSPNNLECLPTWR